MTTTFLRRLAISTATAASLVLGATGTAAAHPVHDSDELICPGHLPTVCAGGDHVGFARLGALLGGFAVEVTR